MSGSPKSAFLVSLLLAVCFASATSAEERSKTPPVPERGAKPASAETRAGTKIPDARALSILIRRTLLSLNDANLTGNYTVLRDLAAPGFQSANNAAKLAEIFTNLRRLDLDLAPVMYFEPKLVRPPEIAANGMLRLSGSIPTQPQQVNFDMLFERIADRWRLFGIAVNTTPAQSGAVTSGAAAQRKD